MRFHVKHVLPGRIRVGYDKTELTPRQAVLAQHLIAVQAGIVQVTVNPITAAFLVFYDAEKISDKKVLACFQALTSRHLKSKELLASVEEPPKDSGLLNALLQMTAFHLFKKLLPPPILMAVRLFNLTPRIFKGTKFLVSGTPFHSEVLDAAAISMAIFTGDMRTAANIHFLLNIGETIEDFTKRQSFRLLANTILSENDKVQRVNGSTERTVHLYEIKTGDLIVSRTGSTIPVDGEVFRGEALVNQAAITGESLAVEKRKGDSVFAGTTVQEGEIFIRVRVVGAQTKVHNILSMIDSSQQYKVSSQIRSERLANQLVKYNFFLALGTFLLTRNMTKVVSTLMVDYSCAMKLVAPIAILSAMREAAQNGILVKGGKFLEDAANADTVVFDKTGTLTAATPTLSRIIPFQKKNEDEILRIAACLEEHFAHPVAKAIVLEANAKKIKHPEDHAKVEYVIAHGIATTLNGKRLLIGSRHFIFEDEKVKQPKKLSQIQEDALRKGESLLYLAENDKLLGILSITDPVRKNAPEIVQSLHKSGISKCIMITGDDSGAAKTAAAKTGIDHYLSNALPEDKVSYISSLQKKGHQVIMIGDGINDAPALAKADTGIAMGECASLTGEIADIVLSPEEGLEGLLKIRILGTRLMAKIHSNNTGIIAINSALLFGGLFGLLSPATAATLHNLSTIAFSVKASAPLLKDQGYSL